MEQLQTVWGAIPSIGRAGIEFAVAIVLALLLHWVVWRGISRLVADRPDLWARVVRRMRRPLRLIFVVAAIGLAGNIAELTDGARVMLSQISLALIVLIIGWFVIIATDVVADRATRALKLDAEDNLAARKQVTQARLLHRTAKVLLWFLTIALVLSTFDAVRSFGVSLFASAGVAGIIAGYAATPVLKNLIAGMQIALTQPIRIDDVVIVEGEWGWIEEIASTYVVVRVWDLRRLIVPLSYFIEQPFQNWTRESASIIGSVNFYLDYTAPIAALREKYEALVRESPRWDGKTVVLQVIETDKDVIQVRGLMSARTSSIAWDLRCEVREALILWLQENHPEALPRNRTEIRGLAEIVDKMSIPA